MIIFNIVRTRTVLSPFLYLLRAVTHPPFKSFLRAVLSPSLPSLKRWQGPVAMPPITPLSIQRLAMDPQS